MTRISDPGRPKVNNNNLQLACDMQQRLVQCYRHRARPVSCARLFKIRAQVQSRLVWTCVHVSVKPQWPPTRRYMGSILITAAMQQHIWLVVISCGLRRPAVRQCPPSAGRPEHSATCSGTSCSAKGSCFPGHNSNTSLQHTGLAAVAIVVAVVPVYTAPTPDYYPSDMTNSYQHGHWL